MGIFCLGEYLFLVYGLGSWLGLKILGLDEGTSPPGPLSSRRGGKGGRGGKRVRCLTVNQFPNPNQLPNP